MTASMLPCEEKRRYASRKKVAVVYAAVVVIAFTSGPRPRP